MPGLLLAFDGADGAGKSTQMRLLTEWLAAQGREVTHCRDPGSTSLGEQLRALLLDRASGPISPLAEMLLYMAARAQLVSEVIAPAMAAGHVVLTDRYLIANLVYQGHAGGVDLEVVRQVGRIVTGDMLPARTFIFDLDPEIAHGRLQREPDRIESRGEEYRRRVREGYLAEAARDPARLMVLDASESIEQLHQQIRTAVEPLLGGSA